MCVHLCDLRAFIRPEKQGCDVMITMDFGISPGCYQVEGVKTLNYSGNSVVK